MMWARSRSLALVVVSYNWRSSITWVSDKGGRVRGLAIVPFRKDGYHHTTPLVYRKYFLEAFSTEATDVDRVPRHFAPPLWAAGFVLLVVCIVALLRRAGQMMGGVALLPPIG